MACRDPYTAFLIGSWDYDPTRKIRDGNDKMISKKIDKKRGIRKIVRKGKDVQPDQWVKGDLRSMEVLMGQRGINTFDTLDYRERDAETGNYALGKYDVLTKLDGFFGQEHKTHFILYFTGHGDEDGSWCFPVTTTMPVDDTAVGDGGERAGRNRGRGASVEGNQIGGGLGGGGAATGFVVQEETGNVTAISGEAGEEGEADGEDDTVSVEEPAPNPDSHSVASVTGSIASQRPDPALALYDLLSFEDIVAKWKAHNKKEEGQQRYLMLILDCCHSGRWAQKVEEYYASRGDEGTGPQPRSKRDICVQAACRPNEDSAVAGDQMGSIFTNKYVTAQERGLAANLALTALDHMFLLQIASIARCSHAIFDPSKRFTPICVPSPHFNDFKFFNCFDDMHLQTN